METAGLSHWADDRKPRARPALSQRGSDLVKVPIENCPQHILLFVFTVPSAKNHCQLCASQQLFSICLLMLIHCLFPRPEKKKKSANSLNQLRLLKNTVVFRRIAEDMNSVHYFLSQLTCCLIVTQLSAHALNKNFIEVKDAISPTVLPLQIIL